MKRTTLSILSVFLLSVVYAQQPKYTPKELVSVFDTVEFKEIHPTENGFERSYLASNQFEIWDLDDDSTTYIKWGTDALLCVEGHLKNHKREGTFNFFVIDKANHSKRYKIWEQNYSNDKLNGLWTTFTLRGTLVSTRMLKDDSLNGISRQFWIDGKTITEEEEFFNGRNKFIIREFGKGGKMKSEMPYENGVVSGTRKTFYYDGSIQETMDFRNGIADGTRKYFYPNGQVWIEQEYKNGKPWSVVANYTDKGQKRDAGTLNDGNGTIIFYNEDGTVREVVNYVNGVADTRK